MSEDDSILTNSLVSQPKTAVRKTDLLNQYLAEVRQYPLLTPEEEHALAVRYTEGDEEAGGG